MITAGHTKSAIPEYTVDEFNMYLRAISKIEREKLNMLLAVQRTAAHGDQQAMQRLSMSLEDQPLGGE